MRHSLIHSLKFKFVKLFLVCWLFLCSYISQDLLFELWFVQAFLDMTVIQLDEQFTQSFVNVFLSSICFVSNIFFHPLQLHRFFSLEYLICSPLFCFIFEIQIISDLIVQTKVYLRLSKALSLLVFPIPCQTIAFRQHPNKTIAFRQHPDTELTTLTIVTFHISPIISAAESLILIHFFINVQMYFNSGRNKSASSIDNCTLLYFIVHIPYNHQTEQSLSDCVLIDYLHI